MEKRENTPIEDSNLAHIGSDEDKAAREAAAALEMNWEGAGEKPGLQIWRVENTRTENDTPNFGINPWPKKKYGQFHRGDSYIVLHTQQDDEEEGALYYDIYFWIGSESSQDEYGVAAYKANELDDLLGDAPIQHREEESFESDEFMEAFPRGVRYLEGGIDSGFREVDSEEGPVEVPKRLFRIKRRGKVTRCKEMPLKCASLNDGDAFVLDAGDVVYTWFGSQVSPFEKSKSAQIAHNYCEDRHGHCTKVFDVADDNEEFWELLGGKGPIMSAEEAEDDVPEETETKMFTVSDEEGNITIDQVPPSRENLDTNKVCMIDVGNKVFVWIGKASSKREQQQAMLIVQKHLKSWDRKHTQVLRVQEGKERRVRGFKKAF